MMSSRHPSGNEEDVYRFLDHTAELGLEIEAGSLEELLEEAARAFAELVAPGGSGEPARRRLTLAPLDEQTLLADWLNELLFLAETDGFVPQALARSEHTPAKLEAEVDGYLDEPRPLVKAATYHGLALRTSNEGNWTGRVLFDV
jgi:SHS2 domain-containing protein